MPDARPLATLTAGLLARKGAARPAMRRYHPEDAPGPDDLGWNDMGEEAPAMRTPASAEAAASPVRAQQDTIARAFVSAGDDPAAPSPAGRRVAFTLRLDPVRHSRLRLAAAAGRCSAQHLITQALDAALARMAEAEFSAPPAGPLDAA